MGLKAVGVWAAGVCLRRESHRGVRAKKAGLVEASVKLAVQSKHTAKLEFAVHLLEPLQ